MSDEVYKTDADDEYQFNETETVVYNKQNKPQAVENLLAKRKLWLMVALIVAAIVLYKLGSLLFSGSKEIPQAPIGAVAEHNIDSATVTQTQSSSLATEPASAASNSTDLNMASEWDERLLKVEQHNQQDNSRLGQLEAKLSQVDANFNQVKAQLGQLQTELHALTTQLANLQRPPAKKTETKPKAAANKAKQAAGVLRPTYHVQAVIPGRAWLVKADDATTVSVATGDLLPGYGAITQINPIQASVMTSSGYTITYKAT